MNQKDLARLLGVSQMTISRALNNLPGISPALRTKILRTMRQHDYVRDRGAARLRGSSGRVIGVIVPDIVSSFFPDLIGGIQSAADAAGYLLLLANSRESYADEVRQIDLLREFKVDGLIIAPAGPPGSTAVYRRLAEKGVPFVFIDRCKPRVHASYVVSDTRGGAFILGQYLAGKGYRNWGYLAGPADISSAREHGAGLRAAFAQTGLPDGNWRSVAAGFDEASGFHAANRLLDESSPDLIVAVNDAVAIGAYRALRQRGLNVPGDMALAGFSDLHGSDLLPAPLTTVRERTEEIGPRAFALLLRRIRHPDAAPEGVRLPAELLPRASA